jgi:protein-tyrosine phosphatase
MGGLNDSALPQGVGPIDGAFNFRDIGGYATETGHVVRRGRIFRSGMMVHFSESGCAQLARLGVQVICDFRTTAERAHAPTRWQAMGAAEYWSRDYETSSAEIDRLMRGADFTAAEARRIMIDNYRVLAFEQAPSYRELLLRIARGQLPIVFNCTAGKDRTGVATAILFSLLGVPRTTILEDYAYTDEALARDKETLVKRGVFKAWREDEAFTPLLRADPEYLSTMFDAVEEKFGSMLEFIERDLKLDRQQMAAIRNQMLEPARGPA